MIVYRNYIHRHWQFGLVATHWPRST